MEIKVKSKYLKISPRKLRLAVDLVRGLKADRAREMLAFQNNKSSRMVRGLVISGLAVAKASEIKSENLLISKIVCTDGPRLKRGKPASKRSYMPIKKRQSHLELVLSDVVEKLDKSDREVKDLSMQNAKIKVHLPAVATALQAESDNVKLKNNK